MGGKTTQIIKKRESRSNILAERLSEFVSEQAEPSVEQL
jgi:hypothetical protein